MGWVRKLPSGRYQGAYRDAAGRTHRQAFELRRDAAAWTTANEEALRRGEWLSPTELRTTVADVAERWLGSLVCGVDTRRHYAKAWRVHLGPAFGAMRVRSVGHGDVQAWVARLSADLAPASVRTYLSYLRTLFNFALDEGLISRNPCRRVALPTVDDAEPAVRLLEPETVAALVDAIHPRFAVLAMLGAGAGLRQGEARGLCVDKVDFLRRTVTVHRQLAYVPAAHRQTEATIGLRAPKTRAGRRTIPVGEGLIEVVAHHLERFGPGPGGLIATNTIGQPIAQQILSDHWRAAVRAVAGPGEVIDFHQLRHFYASSLIAAGENPKVIQVRLGHSSISVTFDVYGHLFPADDERTRAVSDGIVTAVRANIPARVRAREFPSADRTAGQSRLL